VDSEVDFDEEEEEEPASKKKATRKAAPAAKAKTPSAARAPAAKSGSSNRTADVDLLSDDEGEIISQMPAPSTSNTRAPRQLPSSVSQSQSTAPKKRSTKATLEEEAWD